MTIEKVGYTTEALSTGDGRNGQVHISDSGVDLVMSTPKGMGGTGDGMNPEQLFAAGYAACYHSALRSIARSEKLELTDSTVGARVSIGPNREGGFELAVELEVVIPSLPVAKAQELADKAHLVCPYSNATRGNIDVTVSVGDD